MMIDLQGILTGISHNGFSVTLNERNLGGYIIEDALQAILHGSLDIGQFLRQVSKHLISHCHTLFMQAFIACSINSTCNQ